jgi:hypothetical protein
VLLFFFFFLIDAMGEKYKALSSQQTKRETGNLGRFNLGRWEGKRGCPHESHYRLKGKKRGWKNRKVVPLRFAVPILVV